MNLAEELNSIKNKPITEDARLIHIIKELKEAASMDKKSMIFATFFFNEEIRSYLIGQGLKVYDFNNNEHNRYIDGECVKIEW